MLAGLVRCNEAQLTVKAACCNIPVCNQQVQVLALKAGALGLGELQRTGQKKRGHPPILVATANLDVGYDYVPFVLSPCLGCLLL
mmetsp:Transcript_125866/g.187864  ORF Transcript_125866/g.187864 Transcript_125866/m.187864 type:complete len:85 (+) Transcript_125866:432-686(+)